MGSESSSRASAEDHMKVYCKNDAPSAPRRRSGRPEEMAQVARLGRRRRRRRPGGGVLGEQLVADLGRQFGPDAGVVAGRTRCRIEPGPFGRRT